MGNTQGSRAEKSRHFSGDDQGPMMAANKHDYDLYAVDDQSEYSSAIKVCTSSTHCMFHVREIEKH